MTTNAPTLLKEDNSLSVIQEFRNSGPVGRLLLIGVLALLAAIVRKAWLDMDTAWDSLAYHLPFAALRGGLMSQSDYHLPERIEEYYHGFPILPDLIQGIFWRLTSHLQATNFLGLGGLFALVCTLKKCWNVPFSFSLLAFLGIPMVLIQSTSAYVDLFVSCWLTILLLLVFDAARYPERFSTRKLWGVLAAFVIVTNSKMQLIPVALFGLAVLFGLPLIRKGQYGFWNPHMSWNRKLLLAGVALLLVCVAFGTELRNYIKFHNPVYPVVLHGLSASAQGIGLDDKPDYLLHSSHLVRWVLSVFEYQSFDGRNPLWTNGQGDVALSSPALYMGGDFGALVTFNLLWLAFLLRKKKNRYGWFPILFLGALTLLTACLPSSQQVRYYMYWILVVVSVNLMLLMDGLSGEEEKNSRFHYLSGMASFLIFVLCATGFAYVRTSHQSPARAVQQFGTNTELIAGHLKEGEHICVIGKGQLTFLYAPIFHPDLSSRFHYHVEAAYAPSDCRGARQLP